MDERIRRWWGMNFHHFKLATPEEEMVQQINHVATLSKRWSCRQNPRGSCRQYVTHDRHSTVQEVLHHLFLPQHFKSPISVARYAKLSRPRWMWSPFGSSRPRPPIGSTWSSDTAISTHYATISGHDFLPRLPDNWFAISSHICEFFL